MVRLDPTTGQQLLGGMGELHLEVVAERIRREHKLELYTGPVQVARPDHIAPCTGAFHSSPHPSPRPSTRLPLALHPTLTLALPLALPLTLTLALHLLMATWAGSLS